MTMLTKKEKEKEVGVIWHYYVKYKQLDFILRLGFVSVPECTVTMKNSTVGGKLLFFQPT